MFQFTHPGKGATGVNAASVSETISFNSRTLGRVRLVRIEICLPLYGFNSRTLGRVRHFFRGLVLSDTVFQFTHPGKGATRRLPHNDRRKRCFNSRTLGRVRLRFFAAGCLSNVFQFTHPGKGATVWCKVAYYRADKQT